MLGHLTSYQCYQEIIVALICEVSFKYYHFHDFFRKYYIVGKRPILLLENVQY